MKDKPRGTSAEAHWSYVKELLMECGDVDENVIGAYEFMYISAFKHGYGHGLEDGSCNNDKGSN